jgi:membrane associated rhomboid family serine protease
MMNDPEKPRRRHPLEALNDPQLQPIDNNRDDEEVIRSQPMNVINRVPLTKQPYMVWALIAINSLIYAVLLFGMSEREAFEVYQSAWSNRGHVLGDGEYYRLFTAMFLHSYGLPVHIVFNMYALYVIGQSTNVLFGHVRFLIIYILGGLLGSVLSVLLNTANTYSVGASGAVFAIFAGQIIYLYRNREILGPGAIQQLRSALVVAGLNFAVGIFSALGSSSGGSIDNWGHIGGFLGGLILGWYLTPLYVIKPDLGRHDTVIIDDGNPLNQRYSIVIAFVIGLLVLLLIGHMMV